MSIASDILNITNSRNIIRDKMVAAGQATSTDKLAVLADNLIMGGPSIDLSRTCIVNDSVNGDYAGSRYGYCACMFNGNAIFNQPVTIGDNVTICNYMFGECSNFNQPITIPNKVTSCTYMFNRCINFNQPIIIPDSVQYCGNMFGGCYNFNQPVTFGANIYSCYAMFYNCQKFNQPINMPNTVDDCSSMFINCQNFNQPIILSANLTNCAYLFSNCYDYNQNIYMPSNKVINAYRMLYNHNKMKRINVFSRSLGRLRNNSTSIVGVNVAWTSITNGYYNATYNIYLYSNLPEDI